jgi:predicted Zn-dependent protease
LMHALDTLISREPDNPEWGLRLGTLYFSEGAFKLARRAFGRWLEDPPAGTSSSLLIMMAESARLSGDPARSVAVLREALRRYPGDIHVINSLAYTLAQSPATIGEARLFLPPLTQAPPTDAILDTIALLNMTLDETNDARKPVQDDEVQAGASAERGF